MQRPFRGNWWLLVLCALPPCLSGALPPYAAGGMPVNRAGYTVTKVLSIPWGQGRTAVGRQPTRGAVSWTPRYLEVSAAGRIYVGDEINHQVLCYDRAGKHLATFPVLYGGFHLFVDDQERVYVLYRKLFRPFTIGVHRDGRLEREIEVTLPRRSPNGDRVFVDSAGALCLNWMTSWQPVEALTALQTRNETMDIPMTGEKWDYSAGFQTGVLGAERQGFLSRYAPRCYRIDEGAGALVVADPAGRELARIPVVSLIERELGSEPGVRLTVPGSLRVIGDDRDGNVGLVVRNRARAAGRSAFSLALLAPDGRLVLGADCFPSEIHYGAEVQFYLSSVVLADDGAVYQLCSEGEQGVKVVRWSR